MRDLDDARDSDEVIDMKARYAYAPNAADWPTQPRLPALSGVRDVADVLVCHAATDGQD